MEEDDDDLYEPGDAVQTTQSQGGPQQPVSNGESHEMEDVEEEVEEDDDVRCSVMLTSMANSAG